jgi:ABC-type uncharacterized transport system substrate-binding protein
VPILGRQHPRGRRRGFGTGGEKRKLDDPDRLHRVGSLVGDGLVASLARPGGNITGITNIAAELYPKRLELVSELVPQARAIALLVNPNNSAGAERVIRDVQEAARAKGVC